MTEIFMPDDEAIELMAQAIHANYLTDQEALGDSDHPATRPWEDLTEDLQGQNRNQARDNIEKLWSMNLVVTPATGTDGGSPHAISEADVDRLGREEHDRWARQKAAQGYRYGRERVDTEPDKQHPDLLPWSQLPEETKEKDRAPVRRMVEVLAAAGFTVRPDE